MCRTIKLALKDSIENMPFIDFAKESLRNGRIGDFITINATDSGRAPLTRYHFLRRLIVLSLQLQPQSRLKAHFVPR